MCSSWRPIGHVLADVIGRLELEREGASTQNASLNLARPTAVERVATDSRREGQLSIARAQGRGGDPPNAIRETERTGAAKAPASYDGEVVMHEEAITPLDLEPSDLIANRSRMRTALRVVVDNSRRGRTHRPNEVRPRLGVRPRMLLVVSGGH